MANRLKMAMVQTIVRLLQQGWSYRRIARELGIHRSSVARLAAESKPAKAPLGSAGADAESKPAKAPPGSEGLAAASPNAALSIADQGRALPISTVAVEPSCAVAGSEVGTAKVEDDISRAASMALVTASLNQTATPAAATCDPAAVVPAKSHSIPSQGERALASTAAAENVRSRSACEPFTAVIVGKLERGLSGQRIYQDLVGEHGFAGSYYSVRRFVAGLGQSRELPFRRLECVPGEEAQVDFGSGIAIVQPDGQRRRTHVFRIVLSYSRKGYSEAVYRQTTENFIRCLENAFWHFGGVPRRLVLDNLRAAVQKADWFDPELNPKIEAFAAHYGIAVLPTKPYTPRHKGKVERGVDYVQENGLKGHTFSLLEEENRHLLDWEQNVADTRVHGTTRQQVGPLFRAVEKSALQPLPRERFPFFHEAQRTVHRDGHVEVAKAYYSAPPEYLGRRVWVRWDARLVRLFNQRFEQIDVHVRQAPGHFSTHDAHLAVEKISGVERGAVWLLTKVRPLGPDTTRWAEAMLQARGVAGMRVLQGLLNLAKQHSSAALAKASATAWSYGAFRLRTLRTLLERQTPPQAMLPFLEEHEIIRPLAEYAQLVHSAFTKE
jgi:transposase